MHTLKTEELNQLYQVELILRLEAPDLGLDLSQLTCYEAVFAGMGFAVNTVLQTLLSHLTCYEAVFAGMIVALIPKQPILQFLLCDQTEVSTNSKCRLCMHADAMASTTWSAAPGFAEHKYACIHTTRAHIG